ncbi:uncharacterized protein LTR77_004559 [Saxophila tyrrhenica]|uniref:RNase H type-1 domain-containing protein n=1 Tax=Saxophila tyrrhenica TaxID=1690608 RepID=A0AAV9PGB8_9PEZI|nr:hypothetical protein LTR77_004559 [Saxophila tyrrhenica]
MADSHVQQHDFYLTVTSTPSVTTATTTLSEALTAAVASASPLEGNDTSAATAASDIPTSDRTDVGEAALQKKVLTIYADGSFFHTEQIGGAGIAYQTDDGVWAGKAFALGWISGSDEAEAWAMLEALKLARKLMPIQYQRLTIYTDSMWVLMAMENAWTGSRAMNDIFEELRGFGGSGVEARFLWVKAHNGCIGNEVADKLAGLASRLVANDMVRNPCFACKGPIVGSERLVNGIGERARGMAAVEAGGMAEVDAGGMEGVEAGSVEGVDAGGMEDVEHGEMEELEDGEIGELEDGEIEEVEAGSTAEVNAGIMAEVDYGSLASIRAGVMAAREALAREKERRTMREQAAGEELRARVQETAKNDEREARLRNIDEQIAKARGPVRRTKKLWR